jgi:diaminopimelate epimerase
MIVTFYKYQGTGNDFIMIDNRLGGFPKADNELISFLCDRRFGIGADGLILLEEDNSSHFKMVYYNADGNPGSMCGNGGRCIVAFAEFLGIISSKAKFNAVDGLHIATITDGIISLQMQDVTEIMAKPNCLFLDTGSPHHVQMVANLDTFNVLEEGAKLRYGIYGEEGSNINFVEQTSDNNFSVRTYERGVENETLSCGTGVTAVAIGMHYWGKTNGDIVKIHTRGGNLSISFNKVSERYENLWLEGPAKQVFKGKVEI